MLFHIRHYVLSAGKQEIMDGKIEIMKERSPPESSATTSTPLTDAILPMLHVS
jgi:hypothetical protein